MVSDSRIPGTTAQRQITPVIRAILFRFYFSLRFLGNFEYNISVFKYVKGSVATRKVARQRVEANVSSRTPCNQCQTS